MISELSKDLTESLDTAVMVGLEDSTDSPETAVVVRSAISEGSEDFIESPETDVVVGLVTSDS